jgi:hypothetical protein
LYLDHDYMKKKPAPDFWALMPYYVHQQTGGSCSIASATMVLNAIRAPEPLSSTIELFTQSTILERTENSKWTHAVSKMGGGTTLDELKTYFQESLQKLHLDSWIVEAIHADTNPEFSKKLHQLLIENEKSDRNFIVANFLQSELTGDPEGAVGHLAPVGAFDATHNRVLILDPDRQYYEPYWVPESSFLSAISTLDKTSLKPRGILWIHPKS